MALITYSGQAFVQFAFNDPRFNNNSAIIRHLNDLKSIKGTTSTHLALYEATELFDNRNGNSGKCETGNGDSYLTIMCLGVRQGVKRLAIILTDGHSQRSPRAMAKRLANEGVEIFAISVQYLYTHHGKFTYLPFIDVTATVRRRSGTVDDSG
jgi:hypothetical protein